MRAGALKELINIYTYSRVVNNLGESIRTRVLFKTVRAEVIFSGGKEVEDNSQLTPMQNIIFKIRYDDTIDEMMCIEWNSKFYNIRYIEPIRKAATKIVTEKEKSR